MKKYFLILIILFTGLLCACGEEVLCFKETDTFSSLNSTESFQKEYLSYKKLDSTTDFSYLNKFTNMLSEKLFTQNDNYVFSPISLYMALGMLANGSSGETQNELIQLLSLGNDITINELNENLQKIYRHNQYENKNGTAKMANSLWVKKDFEVKNSYINDLTTYYNAELYGTMFDETGKENIAKWINYNTDNMLNMKTTDIQTNSYTALMLINTLYFNNKWKIEFKTKNNYQDIFYGTTEKQVEYIKHSVDSSQYFASDKFELVIDYFQNNNKIVYILPSDNVSINEIFAGDYLSLAMNNLESCSATIALPKFKTNNSYNLNQVLEDLGLKTMFDGNKANFSNISDNPLVVSCIKQDVAIELSEEGVKAAASTSIMADKAVAYEKIVNIVLNKPFIYIIYDEMDVPLFVGTIQNF